MREIVGLVLSLAAGVVSIAAGISLILVGLLTYVGAVR